MLSTGLAGHTQLQAQLSKKLPLKSSGCSLCILPHRLKVTADKKVQTLVSDEKSEEVYRIKIVNLCFNT